MDKSISLVISCFNEEGNINKLVERCQDFLLLENSELILVNNGSIDKTKQMIEEQVKNSSKIKLINIKKNIGFGNGVWTGLRHAKYNILSYTHADLQTSPEDVLDGLKIINDENQFVKGIRTNKLKNNWSFFDIFISYGMTLFTSLMMRKYMNDIHAQPVIFTRDMYNKIKFFPNDFMIDVWVFYIAKIKEYRIIRFPVDFNKEARLYGEGSNDTILKTIKESFLHIVGTFKIIFKPK